MEHKTKKILIIGPSFHYFNECLQRSFVNKGFNTKVYAIVNKTTINDRVYYWIFKRQTNKFKIKNVNFNSIEVMKKFTDFEPDIVLIIKGNSITSATLKYMKEKAIVLLWMMDSLKYNYINSSDLALYDKIFVFEKTDLDILTSIDLNGVFLPLAFDPQIYYKIDVKKDIDISFVGVLGSHYKTRVTILENLIKDFPNLNIKIYGTYISKKRVFKYYRFKKSILSKSFMNHNVNQKEINMIYNRSKICLNIHHKQSDMGWNPRTVEILGSGNFQICDYKKLIHNEFENSLVLFNDYNDLKMKIDYYLSNYDEAENIAFTGYNQVIYKDTYDNRIDIILNEVALITK